MRARAYERVRVCVRMCVCAYVRMHTGERAWVYVRVYVGECGWVYTRAHAGMHTRAGK